MTTFTRPFQAKPRISQVIFFRRAIPFLNWGTLFWFFAAIFFLVSFAKMEIAFWFRFNNSMHISILIFIQSGFSESCLASAMNLSESWTLFVWKICCIRRCKEGRRKDLLWKTCFWRFEKRKKKGSILFLSPGRCHKRKIYGCTAAIHNFLHKRLFCQYVEFCRFEVVKRSQLGNELY